MNNPFINLSMLFGMLLVISCSAQNKDSALIVENPTYGVWQDLEKPPLQFKLEQTFGDDRKIMLPAIWQLQVPVADSAGNIYVIDGKNGHLYSFTPDGKVRWKRGKKGKGPGDFERPQGLVIDDGYLYTGNVSGSRIDQFDLEGDLVSSTTVEALELSFTDVEGVISDSLLVTSSSLWGKVGSTVTILNIADNLQKVAQFDVVLPGVDFGKGLAYSLNVSVADSLIVTGNVQNYALQFYNYQGEKVKTVKRDFEKLVRPGFIQSDGSRAIRGFGSLSPPVFLSKDYFMTTLSWPTNVDDPDQFFKKAMDDRANALEVKWKNAMDLYHRKGSLLYSLEQNGSSPEIGTIAYVDEDGRIYTKSDKPFPQIRRYSLTIASPNENKITQEAVEADG